MAHIARLYADRDAASAAIEEIKREGYDHGDTHLIAASATPGQEAEPGADAVLEQVRQAGVAPAAAVIFAEHIRRGEVLVVIKPLFMQGVFVTEILDGFHPIAVELPPLDPQPSAAERRAAPLSTWLHWPVLSSNPTPLSTRLGWPTLTAQPAASATLSSVRKQSRQAAPLSRAIHLPTLSRDPAPLSSRLKWRPLWGKAAPLSDKLKLRVLLEDPAPLSRRLRWRQLSKNPAPLSSLLGLPVLTKRQ